jgi:hypothetical protein
MSGIAAWYLVLVMETVLSPYYPTSVAIPMASRGGCERQLEAAKQHLRGKFSHGFCIEAQ